MIFPKGSEDDCLQAVRQDLQSCYKAARWLGCLPTGTQPMNKQFQRARAGLSHYRACPPCHLPAPLFPVNTAFPLATTLSWPSRHSRDLLVRSHLVSAQSRRAAATLRDWVNLEHSCCISARWFLTFTHNVDQYICIALFQLVFCIALFQLVFELDIF